MTTSAAGTSGRSMAANAALTNRLRVRRGPPARLTFVRIGILGGTGPAGKALAARLASVGYEVVIGSRSKYRAMETVDQLLEKEWPDRHLPITAGDNKLAADTDVVVIATPWDGATQTAASVRDNLRGKVVMSMANALTRLGREFQPLVPPRGSVAASVQAAVPQCLVAAAFHHVPAKELGDLSEPIESDVLICSDHVSAFDTASGEVVPFTPGPIVTMYTCGITPYDSTHIGHAAVYVTYDVLQRRLRDLGHRTLCVRNVTDIDDPLFAKARELGVHYLDLAAEELARFERDMAALNMLPVASSPR